MRHITFSLLCVCTWWIGNAAVLANLPLREASTLTNIPSEHPDFIVADIVMVHGDGTPLTDCEVNFPCDEPEKTLGNGQILYLPQTPPGSNTRAGYIIKFAYTANPAIRGQFIAWINCDGLASIANICALNGVQYTQVPKGSQIPSISFTIPNTPFLFKVSELTGAPSPALVFEMVECNASYCKKNNLIGCDPKPPGHCNIEVLKECRQTDTGNWFSRMTLYYNDVPIRNTNDPNCCVTWEYVNGIPTIPCPRPAGLPNMNYTPMNLSEGQHYKVTIVCGTCTYTQEGTINCDGGQPRQGEGGDRSPEVNTLSQSEKPTSALLSVYPNPANNQLALRINPEALDLGDYNFVLFDAFGRKVLDHQMQNESNWQIMDISSFNPGLYVWRLMGRDGEQHREMGKVLIVH